MDLREDLIRSLNLIYSQLKALKDKEIIKVYYEVALAIEDMLGFEHGLTYEEITITLAD